MNLGARENEMNEPVRARPNCPKCGENRLRIDDYGINCSCGWSPTVKNCGRCLCPVDSCTGHFYGNSEKKDRSVRPCPACEQVVEEATV